MTTIDPDTLPVSDPDPAHHEDPRPAHRARRAPARRRREDRRAAGPGAVRDDGRGAARPGARVRRLRAGRGAGLAPVTPEPQVSGGCDRRQRADREHRARAGCRPYAAAQRPRRLAGQHRPVALVREHRAGALVREPRAELCDDPTENAERTTRRCRCSRHEPTDPMDSTDPSDHSERTEPRDPIDQRLVTGPGRSPYRPAARPRARRARARCSRWPRPRVDGRQLDLERHPGHQHRGAVGERRLRLSQRRRHRGRRSSARKSGL